MRVRISTDRTSYTNFFRGKMRFLRAAGLGKTIVIFGEESYYHYREKMFLLKKKYAPPAIEKRPDGQQR